MPPTPPRHMPPKGQARITPRRRVLAQWRGIDLTPIQEAQTLRVRPMKELMSQLLSKVRLEQRRGEAEIARAWNNLMAPEIVAHAQPVGLRKGTLFVVVDSSVWLSEIVRYRRMEILERLQHCFGRSVIAKISYRAG